MQSAVLPQPFARSTWLSLTLDRQLHFQPRLCGEIEQGAQAEFVETALQQIVEPRLRDAESLGRRG